MSKKKKLEVIKRLIARGEVFSAKLACMDWHISEKEFEKMVGENG